MRADLDPRLAGRPPEGLQIVPMTNGDIRAVLRIERDLLGRSQVYLRGHADVLTVSRSFLARFKQT